MKISELSRASGASVATIKYYLREGLLPAGENTARNQAQYGEEHLHRLRLVRTLIDVGGLSIAAVRSVLQALDDQRVSLHKLLGVAHRALAPAASVTADAQAAERARGEVQAFLSGLGWNVSADVPAALMLADALVALRGLGWDAHPEIFRPYAEAVDGLASTELDGVPDGLPRSQLVEYTVVGTVVFETALVALRRLAQAHHSAIRFPATGERESAAG